MAGLQTNTGKPILTGAFHAGAVKPVANEAASDNKDIDRRTKLLADAVKTLQSQLDTVNVALRQNVPLPNDFYLTDPTGRVIARFGFQAIGATQVYGLAVADLAGNPAGFVGVQTELPQTITATSNASPDVITINAHGYVNGDTLLIQGATGDTAINIVGIVEHKTTNNFQLTDLLGNPINGNGAYAGGGTATRFFGGGYFQTLAIGGTSVPTGKIRAFADGNVIINGATITLDINGVTTTIGNLPVGAAGTAGVDVKNDTAPSQDVMVTDKGFYIRATDQATFVVTLSAGGDNGSLTLSNLAGTDTVILNTGGGSFTVGANTVVIAPPVVSISDGAHTNTQNATTSQANILNALVALEINGTTIVNVTRDANFNSVAVGGTTRIDSSGNVISANGFTGSDTFVKTISINFVGQSFTTTNGTVTTVAGIVTNMS